MQFSWTYFVGLFSIGNIQNTARKMYFSFDLMVSLSTWMVTQKNTVMIIVHALIHIGAVSHLFSIIRTKIYGDIFEMGELDFNNKAVAVIVFYIWGTTQDICTHLLDVYYLMISKNKVFPKYTPKSF
eukprot:228878_1